MRHDFYLAWRYLRHHRVRTLILIACLGLIAALPLALHQLLDQGREQLTARARSTPMLVGAKGSAMDLTLNVLYFSESAPEIPMSESDRVTESGLADTLPINTRFRVRGHPLVGVTLDYFDFRGLTPARGRQLAMIGECLLGADAAQQLGLEPGDTLLTMPENAFDLAGIYPLKLHVVGILERAESPDDRAVFVDLKTTWVIQGLGHGHAEGAGNAGNPLPWLAGIGQARLTDPEPVTFNEITPDNLASFHFHGDPSTYPISAVIVRPHDRKSAALLRGRYLDGDIPTQIVRPAETATRLLESIFRVSAVFDGVLFLVAGSTLLVVALVFALSLRLRERELQTIFLLGSSRWTVLRLVAAEIVLIALGSGVLCAVLLLLAERSLGTLMRNFIVP